MGLFKPNVEKLEAKGDVAGLVRAAHSDDNQIKSAAFDALARQGGPAIGPLLQVLTGAAATESERYLAAVSLGKIGSEAAARALVDAIGVLAPRLGWTSETGYLDDFVLQGVVDGLNEIGAPAVGPILEVFPGHDLRARLAPALGYARDPRAVGPLTDALRGDDATADLARAVCAALTALSETQDGAETMERIGTREVLEQVRRSAEAAGDAETAGWAAAALRALCSAGVAPPTSAERLREAEEEIIGAARRVILPSQELTHFFVCSSNPSLIQAFDGLFRVGAPTYGGSASRLHATRAALDARRQAAVSEAPRFAGRMLMLSAEREVAGLADMLGALGAQSGSSGLWVAHVSVGPEGLPWVRQVYDQLVRQAIPQGILPFPMYSTEDPDAARFLLESLEIAEPD